MERNMYMMNRIVMLAALVVGFHSPLTYAAGFKGEKFSKVFYLEAGGKGAQSGLGAMNAKDFLDSDLMSIDAGMIIDKVYVVIDAAVSGTTVFKVGDDDAAEGFVKNLSVTLGTPGIYGWSAKTAGSYLFIQTAGVSAAADIYVVPNAKYYPAAGKEVKLDVTGAATAGRARVIVEGYKAAY